MLAFANYLLLTIALTCILLITSQVIQIIPQKSHCRERKDFSLFSNTTDKNLTSITLSDSGSIIYRAHFIKIKLNAHL